MDCKSCVAKSEGEKPDTFFSLIIKRKNRENLLLFVLCILLIVGFTAYVIIDKILDSQYETVSEDIRVISDDTGDANYIGHDGDITYHGSDTD